MAAPALSDGGSDRVGGKYGRRPFLRHKVRWKCDFDSSLPRTPVEFAESAEAWDPRSAVIDSVAVDFTK